MHTSWVAPCSLRSHANRASLEQDQIGSRRTGAAHSRGLRGATLDVHYPAPIGSDTFFREIVDPPVGETDTSERLRAVAELTLDFSVHRGPAFAGVRGLRLAFARRRVEGLFCHVPPRRGPRSAEPKVSSIREEYLRRSSGPRPADQVKLTTTPEGGTLSTTCSQPVDKCPRLFHPAAYLL